MCLVKRLPKTIVDRVGCVRLGRVGGNASLFLEGDVPGGPPPRGRGAASGEEGPSRLRASDKSIDTYIKENRGRDRVADSDKARNQARPTQRNERVAFGDLYALSASVPSAH
jgi:hypothetical protein